MTLPGVGNEQPQAYKKPQGIEVNSPLLMGACFVLERIRILGETYSKSTKVLSLEWTEKALAQFPP